MKKKKDIISISSKKVIKLKALAKKKEYIRGKLEVTAKQLATTAEEKEDVRSKLAVTAKKLVVIAEQLAVVAKEKESIRVKLQTTAKNLKIKAEKLVAIAKEKESVRRKLAVTAREKERVRKKLAITAKALSESRETLEQKVLERTKDLEQARAIDEAMLTSIGNGIIATDKNARVIFTNEATEKLIGWEREEVIGKLWFELVPMEDEKGNTIPDDKRPIQQAIAHRKSTTTTTTTYYFVRKNKTKFPVAVTATPIILNGKVIGAVGVYRDITREKEVDKAKTEFVSLASHQLRTPLTDVSWHTEMILKGDLGEVVPEQKKYLEAIYQGNKRMIELVNTLLDVSRLELGTFKVTPSPTDVIALAQSVLDEQKLEIEKKKLVIVEKLNKDVPISSTDPKLLRMVFQNLLANAVEYTPEKGTVCFEVALDTAKENILITVADTGYGIPKNQKDKIFTKLFRADNIRKKDTDGTGLGLYIVKSIVENSGGKIRFESEENKGTTFYVTLPLSGKENKESSKELS